MKKFQLQLNTPKREREIDFEVKGVINGGFSGRNQDQVISHINELEEEGVSPPEEIPAFYPLSPNMLTTDDNCIEVTGKKTSGEVEYVLLIGQEDIFVTVGSDHTDRELEKINISASKQVTPNVLGEEVWTLTELEKNWDRMVLRSYLYSGSKRIKYQEGKLAELLRPKDLIKQIKERVIDGKLSGLVIFSGTVPLSVEEVVSGHQFEAVLHDPVRGKESTLKYDYKRFPWLS